MQRIALGLPPPLLLLLIAAFAMSGCTASKIDSSQTSPSQGDPTKATPVISWLQPAPITNPAPLTSAQLDATANVAGTFAYSPAAGTVLPAGTQTLRATFTPEDTTDYTIATASVTIVVNPAASVPPNVNDLLAVADSGNNRVLIYNTPLTAGESASIAIGQTSLTEGLPNQGNASPSAATLYTPTGLAMDSAGNLWVADDHNCRVLEFQPPFATGMSATLVIGQPYFGAPPYCGTTAGIPEYGGLPESWYPVGMIAFDSQGNLWVANGMAGRVVEFVPPFSNGMSPSVAVGQPTLEDTAPCNGGQNGEHGPALPPTAAALCGPVGIAFDPQGDLWVTDEGNVRLVEFVPPFSTGMAASLEMIGQPPIAFDDNGTSCNDTSASNFCGLDSVAFDQSGDLWVADLDFQRVLEFVPPFSNGMAASAVIGQPNFTDYGPWDPGAAGEPAGLSFDSGGNLIVSGAVPGSSNGNGTGKVVAYAAPLNSGMGPTTSITSSSDCPLAFGATEGGMQSITASANSFCDPIGVLAF
jgi:sugar lactone lactonase YvrE